MNLYRQLSRRQRNTPPLQNVQLKTIDGPKVTVESSSYETLPITNVNTTEYTTKTEEMIEEVVARYTEVKTTLEKLTTEVIEAPKVSQTSYSTIKTTTEYTTTEYSTEEVVEEVFKPVVLGGSSVAEVVESVETMTSEYITEVKELPKVTEETSTTTTMTYEDVETKLSEFSAIKYVTSIFSASKPSQKVESTVTEYTTIEELIVSFLIWLIRSMAD
ncbi:hypothetical protein HK098_001307 [Nowakowskiella sp. JEL0407]|nr:hypothetical protein HK098_001307 [Nowakowskiella sp. JEL0407]